MAQLELTLRNFGVCIVSNLLALIVKLLVVS
jgi:hypothetical protein